LVNGKSVIYINSHSRSAALINPPNLSTTLTNPLQSISLSLSPAPDPNPTLSRTIGSNAGATLLSAILRNINSWWRSKICWYATRCGKSVVRIVLCCGGGWIEDVDVLEGR
jgi:hypothetical protein